MLALSMRETTTTLRRFHEWTGAVLLRRVGGVECGDGRGRGARRPPGARGCADRVAARGGVAGAGGGLWRRLFERRGAGGPRAGAVGQGRRRGGRGARPCPRL